MSIDTILGLVFGGGGAGLVGLVLKYRGDVANRKASTENTSYGRLEAENARIYKQLEDEQEDNARLRKELQGADDEIARLRRGATP